MSGFSNTSAIPSVDSVSLDDLVGTAFYISPEMVEHRKASFSSDLWAFGVILYQLYSGELPFTGSTEEAIFNKVC
jgi:serine/threonine protein kinase